MEHTTETTTDLMKELINFKRELKHVLEQCKEWKELLDAKQFTEYTIEWNAKDLITANLKCYVYNSLLESIEEQAINHYNLQRFIRNEMRHLISIAKSYRHNSTCPWRNAVNFAKNEAMLDIIQMVERYIIY